MDDQHILIDAAIAAGVKRFFPSEYGSCTTSPKVQAFPLYAPMAKTRKYLQEKAQSGRLTWTVLACGAFLDFVLESPNFIDFANHKATLLDGGNNRVSSTSLLNIGKAIAASLKNMDATKNRVVHISEVIFTQNKILSIAKETKPEIKWEIGNAQSKELLKESLEQLSVVEFKFPTIVPIVLKLVTATAFGGDEYRSAYDETDNELLGIEELTEEELKKLVAGKLA
jgi:NmrA-like family